MLRIDRKRHVRDGALATLTAFGWIWLLIVLGMLCAARPNCLGRLRGTGGRCVEQAADVGEHNRQRENRSCPSRVSHHLDEFIIGSIGHRRK